MKRQIAASLMCLTLMTTSWAKQDSPVTIAEADQSFKKAYSHLQQTLQLPAAKFTVSTSKAIFTRDIAIQRFHAMYEYIKPKIQTRVKPLTVDAKKISPGLTRERQRQLSTLISFALVPADSAVAAGTKTQYTPKEFGKVLGTFITQVMEITHVQDPRFSPELMPD